MAYINASQWLAKRRYSRNGKCRVAKPAATQSHIDIPAEKVNMSDTKEFGRNLRKRGISRRFFIGFFFINFPMLTLIELDIIIKNIIIATTTNRENN